MALRAGEEHAFSYFYDKYSIPLYRQLLKMVKYDFIAEELLQDLFIKVWEKRSLINLELSFKSYLYTIGQRLVYDHYRKLAVESKLKIELSKIGSEFYSNIDESLLADEHKTILNDLLSLLTPQQQQVFRLCKIEGRSYQEVSRLLGLSVGTINTHITRASQLIRNHIRESKSDFFIIVLAWVVYNYID